MLIKALLGICLSLVLLSCDASLPPKPDGWHCTYFDKKFYCAEINNPDNTKDFDIDSVEMEKAQCQPLETFERYSAYVSELKELARKRCQ